MGGLKGWRRAVACLLGGLFALSATSQTSCLVGEGGSVLLADGSDLLDGRFVAVEKPWRCRSPLDVEASSDGLTRKVRFEFSTGTAAGTLRFAQNADGSVDGMCEFTPTNDVKVATFHFALKFPVSRFARGAFIADGARVDFPTNGVFPSIVRRVRTLSVVDNENRTYVSFRFPDLTQLLVQDNRRFNGPDYELRLMMRGTKDGVAAKGRRVHLKFGMSCPGGVRLGKSERSRRSAGAGWVPLKPEKPWIVPGSALDFSQAPWFDGPAGAHGRVVARGDHFEFLKRPGEPQRFYGVNLCFSACCPPVSEAKEFAANLRRFGYNSVRIHHHDGLFFRKGVRPEVDEENARRLDALLAALYAEGIYVTTDLYVSRPVTCRQAGLDRNGEIGQKSEYKELVVLEGPAQDDFFAHARAFLSRVNTVTGRRYADEPGLAFLSLVNEGNPGNRGTVFFRDEPWRKAWTRYLSAHPEFSDVPDEIPPSLETPSRAAACFCRFLQEAEERFAAKARRFLTGEMRCRALVTDMNGWSNPSGFHLVRRRHYDFFDDHRYVDHPEFLGKVWQLPWQCPNLNTLKLPSMGVLDLSQRRIFAMPYTVSEYNYSAPGRYRAAGALILGAHAALQDWAGVWRFCWSHSESGITVPEKRPGSTFDLSSDPLNLASDRIFVSLFLRGDLPALSRRCVMPMAEGDVERVGERPYRLDDISFRWIGWWYRLGCLVGEEPGGDDLVAGRYPDVYRVRSEDLRRRAFGEGPLPTAGDGRVKVDGEGGSLAVATPRTCAIFTEASGGRAGALRISATDAPVTVCATVADGGKDITSAKRLVVLHLTQVDNTGATYSDLTERTTLAPGGLPQLVRSARTRIGLKVSEPEKRAVYALSRRGERLARIPTLVEKGHLVFTAAVDRDPSSATFAYEVE